jgi:hypothetical protein
VTPNLRNNIINLLDTVFFYQGFYPLNQSSIVFSQDIQYFKDIILIDLE